MGPDGFLIYETFGVGNDLFGKPSNPNFLLRPSELKDSVGDEFLIIDEFLARLQIHNQLSGVGSSHDE